MWMMIDEEEDRISQKITARQISAGGAFAHNQE